ncbi:NADPH-dependent FMN reductase [Tissierella sp. Yu-01]|uniref:NADPH-dependent FMN reductase n=1 Tax=Tissierella sp. Yu-01 TaxID=3035694 RepID=UPI00240E0323|nr:NADPH-dependent FMN reductase [Tissierella sp. Yu-01]WFA08102.1 NAD(P)H-dependent oxidoreductase [Tissierella sp. Yu-01]
MDIAVIVGSLRKESYNKKIAEFIIERYKDNVNMEIIPIDKLPLFNEDLESNPPIEVKEFKRRIKESYGVIFVTPEYNHSIPGGLKNALDWCSRVDRVLVNKPVFIIGASNGNVGTARCQSHLTQILNSPGVMALNLPSTHVLIPNVQEYFDEENKFIDKRTIKYLDKVVAKFMQWIEKLK